MTDWFRCPNDPPCGHGAILHDVMERDDPSPRCCVEGCDCGGEIDITDHRPEDGMTPDQAYLALDLWMALGLDSKLFDPYRERNGLSDTWSNLLAAVRREFQGDDWCKHLMDGGTDFCTLRPGHFGPHWSTSDIGTSEPLPWPDEEADREPE